MDKAERSLHMEIRVLRYFLTVVREESITKAAEVLHITQPTLSRQLAQMEEEIGVRLFDRGTRKIRLTNEGLLLRRRAEEILQLVDKTEKELVEQEEQVEGKISIGCGEVASVQMLPDLIRNFHQKYPLVTFDLFTATADLVKEQMDKGLLDLGLLLEPIEMGKYEFIRLDMKERWVVLMPPDDPLAGKKHVKADELAELPLILPRRMQVQSELASWFGDYYKNLNILFTSNLSTNGAVMVSRGLAYSLVIEGAVPFWDSSKIGCRPLYPELMATCVLAWKREQPFSLAAAKFIEYAKCFLSMDKS
jgi:DNA-binding transcriptional LysR family regulator